MPAIIAKDRWFSYRSSALNLEKQLNMRTRCKPNWLFQANFTPFFLTACTCWITKGLDGHSLLPEVIYKK